MRYTYILILILVGVISVGCSGAVFKQFSIDGEDSSVSVDARQRVILVTNQSGPDDKGQYRKVVCAEPSPDAMVALAASASLSVGDGTKKIGAGGSLSEAVANISQRTQTIQLLRDGLFRACEAYMNGIVGKAEYHSIVLGYDDFVVTILAIDGITGAGQSPPTIVIGGTASTGNSKKDNNTATNTVATDASAGIKNEINVTTSSTPVSDSHVKEIAKILKAYYAQQRWYVCRKAGTDQNERACIAESKELN